MSEQLDDFVPESLSTKLHPAAPASAPQWRSASAKVIQFFMWAFLATLAVAWLNGFIDPPSDADAMRKAYKWAKDKAPIGSQIQYADRPVEETMDGVMVLLYVRVPGERDSRYVSVNLKQKFRWWSVD